MLKSRRICSHYTNTGALWHKAFSRHSFTGYSPGQGCLSDSDPAVTLTLMVNIITTCEYYICKLNRCQITHQITQHSLNWYSWKCYSLFPKWIPTNSAILSTLPDQTLLYEPIFSFSPDDKTDRREMGVSVLIQLTVCMYWSHQMKLYTGSEPGTNWSGWPT